MAGQPSGRQRLKRNKIRLREKIKKQIMKTCKNCYYYGKCGENNRRCEYYDPVYGFEQIILNEYERDLRDRVNDYTELVEEQQR